MLNLRTAAYRTAWGFRVGAWAFGLASAFCLTAVPLAAQSAPAENLLKLAYPNDPDTINAVLASDTVSEAFQRYVYEPLAQRRFPDPNQWENRLAESYEFDEANLEFTIHLRKGVKWHPMKLPNGTDLPETELTARDVKFTFDCILNAFTDAAHFRNYYEDPQAEGGNKYMIQVSTSRKDKHLVKIKWTKPYFQLKEFSLNVPIMPLHVYSVDAKGEPISFDYLSKEFAEGFNNHWANNKMCGTGPLRFVSWEKNQRLVLEKNPTFWGEPMHFTKLIYECIPNSNTSYNQVLKNELDWVGIAEKDMFLQAKEKESVKDGKVVLEKYDYPSYRYLGFNLRKEFFRDVKVRHAVAHAIPVQQIIDQVFKGLAKRSNGPFLEGSPAANPDVKPIPYDLDTARKLLDEAGWKPGADGRREKTVNGTVMPARFDLVIFADSPSFQTVGEIIKENCRRVGVEVQLSPVKWGLFLQKLRKKEFDACLLGWALSWQQDPYQIWHSSQADVLESSNSIGYANPEVDKLIEKLRYTLDENEQTKLYREIHAKIFADQPYVFLFDEQATGARDARLTNVHFYKLRPCIDIREWGWKTPRN